MGNTAMNPFMETLQSIDDTLKRIESILVGLQDRQEAKDIKVITEALSAEIEKITDPY